MDNLGGSAQANNTSDTGSSKNNEEVYIKKEELTDIPGIIPDRKIIYVRLRLWLRQRKPKLNLFFLLTLEY